MIFLDTGYYIALSDNKESHHIDSLKIKEYIDDLNETTVINTTVLVETLNKSVKTGENIKELYDDISSESIIVSLTKEDYLKSLEINGWYGNSVNYSDCTIVHTMMDMGINRILSFDACFKKIGKYDLISSAWGGEMCVHYEFKNRKLKKLVEKKAEELDISVNRLVYNYINRGLMDDCRDEDVFVKCILKNF